MKMIRIFLNFMLAILMSLSLGLETVQPVMAGDASASRQRSQSETPALINAARPPAGSSYAPGASDTSVYMIGSTTVGVVFIESVGSGETWSAPRQAEVSGEITAALDQWEGWGGMDAGLSFVVDTRAIGVNQEPITLDSADTSWEYEALGTIPGVTGGTDAERAYSFDNQLRLANSTDWPSRFSWWIVLTIRMAHFRMGNMPLAVFLALTPSSLTTTARTEPKHWILLSRAKLHIFLAQAIKTMAAAPALRNCLAIWALPMRIALSVA